MHQKKSDPNKSFDKDSSICYIYKKTGACLGGIMKNCCLLHHVQNQINRCIVFHHLYPNPKFFASFFSENDKPIIDPIQEQQGLDAFFMDIYLEVEVFGKVEDMIISGNISRHLYGNVYVRFVDPASALACMIALQGRYYAGRKVVASFVPTNKLSSIKCKDNEGSTCIHEDKCHFVHPLKISPHVLMQAFPRSHFMIPDKLRDAPKNIVYDSPDDLLYGRSRLLKR